MFPDKIVCQKLNVFSLSQASFLAIILRHGRSKLHAAFVGCKMEHYRFHSWQLSLLERKIGSRNPIDEALVDRKWERNVPAGTRNFVYSILLSPIPHPLS